MTYHIIGYRIKWNDTTIRVCSGWIEMIIWMCYYCGIRRIAVTSEEFFVHEDRLP
jgi:hypothetical protein